MRLFYFEGIPLTVPDGIEEMRGIFARLLDKDAEAREARAVPAVISFFNPEIFLAQQKDGALHEYFARARFNFIDGIGLIRAINRKLGLSLGAGDRYPGTDFFDYLPPGRECRVYIYGSKTENIEDAKIRIERAHPNVRVVEWTFGFTKFDGDFLVQKINAALPDIVIVCKGCPLQERWIFENAPKLNARIVFGNGGAVDFWSGQVKRAPAFLIRAGLEWLWRLFASFSFKRLARQMKLVPFLLAYKRGRYKIEEKTDGHLSHGYINDGENS